MKVTKFAEYSAFLSFVFNSKHNTNWLIFATSQRKFVSTTKYLFDAFSCFINNYQLFFNNFFLNKIAYRSLVVVKNANKFLLKSLKQSNQCYLNVIIF